MRFQIKDLLHIFLLSTGIFLFVIDLFIINVSLPTVQHALHLHNSDTQWIIILYIIGYASLLINAGNAGNHYGKKKLYLIGMAGFTVASLLCGLANNLYILLVGRLIQGISSGLMVPQGIALITLRFENPEKRSMALGIYGSIAGIASVIGQLLGGILPDQTWIHESWRLIFLINVPIGAVACFAVYRYTAKDQVYVKSSVSFKPMVTLFMLLMGIIFPLIMGPDLKWPLWSLLVLGTTLVFVLLFLKKQRKLEKMGYPSVLNFTLFNNRVFNLGLLAALAYYMVQDAYFIINSNYLQNQKNYTATMTGIAFVYQGIGYVLASVTVSRLIQHHGKIVVLYGLGIMILGLLAHLFILNTMLVNSDQVHILFFFYGIGCGSVLPALMTLALKDLNEKLISVGSAIYLTIQQLSICLGIAFIVGVFLHQKENKFFIWQHISSAYGYSIALSVILLLFVLGSIAYLPSQKLK
ncbi:MFS transporter [Sphingobacterium paramultivorum]|uniref:MFS transporter n=1 Tax=Sphingobacterium paramultivorum TaxID=2886510 RepID=A0A7G5E0E3_9SPHI|nr:MFS transporter [Sphingobacterium paramultivorum]QMV67468.1 MFS transporter [Sphingobacterium paramultivorum]WSO16336.1 MFS transporter [Sphingobacterium paramultivorum]